MSNCIRSVVSSSVFNDWDSAEDTHMTSSSAQISRPPRALSEFQSVHDFDNNEENDYGSVNFNARSNVNPVSRVTTNLADSRKPKIYH